MHPGWLLAITALLLACAYLAVEWRMANLSDDRLYLFVAATADAKSIESLQSEVAALEGIARPEALAKLEARIEKRDNYAIARLGIRVAEWALPVQPTSFDNVAQHVSLSVSLGLLISHAMAVLVLVAVAWRFRAHCRPEAIMALCVLYGLGAAAYLWAGSLRDEIQYLLMQGETALAFATRAFELGLRWFLEHGLVGNASRNSFGLIMLAALIAVRSGGTTLAYALTAIGYLFHQSSALVLLSLLLVTDGLSRPHLLCRPAVLLIAAVPFGWHLRSFADFRIVGSAMASGGPMILGAVTLAGLLSLLLFRHVVYPRISARSETAVMQDATSMLLVVALAGLLASLTLVAASGTLARDWNGQVLRWTGRYAGSVCFNLAMFLIAFRLFDRFSRSLVKPMMAACAGALTVLLATLFEPRPRLSWPTDVEDAHIATASGERLSSVVFLSAVRDKYIDDDLISESSASSTNE